MLRLKRTYDPAARSDDPRILVDRLWLAEFAQAGVYDAALAEQLLHEGTQSFDKSWASPMECIASKERVYRNTAAAHAASQPR